MTADTRWQQMTKSLLAEKVSYGEGQREHRKVPGSLVTFTHAPLVGVRSTAWQNALYEMEWLLYDEGVLSRLHPKAHHWWHRHAHDGIVPGMPKLDIGLMVGLARYHPTSRRNVLTNFGLHTSMPRNDFVAQVTTSDQDLDLFVFQRTANMLTGVNHNWIQFWALGMYVAYHAKRRFRAMRWVVGDVHLYEAHAAVALDCVRCPSSPQPELVYEASVDDFRADDFTLSGKYVAGISTPVEYI